MQYALNLDYTFVEMFNLNGENHDASKYFKKKVPTFVMEEIFLEM